MTKPTEQVYSTNVPIYDQKLQLIVSKNVNQSMRARDISTHEAIACTITHGNAVCIIIPLQKRAVSNLSHEIVHAAFEILKRRDINVTYKSQEALAYLVGWIAHWIDRVAK